MWPPLGSARLAGRSFRLTSSSDLVERAQDGTDLTRKVDIKDGRRTTWPFGLRYAIGSDSPRLRAPRGVGLDGAGRRPSLTGLIQRLASMRSHGRPGRKSRRRHHRRAHRERNPLAEISGLIEQSASRWVLRFVRRGGRGGTPGRQSHWNHHANPNDPVARGELNRLIMSVNGPRVRMEFIETRESCLKRLGTLKTALQDIH